MSWRAHGHAKVDPRNPRAFGVCQRCGFLYNREDLTFQYEWRGNELVNTWAIVCTRTCYDKPDEQLRPKALPADPVPIFMPTTENYAAENQGVSAATVGKPPLIVPED